MDETSRPTSIVIAGAGYAGLHIALRLGSWVDHGGQADMTLIDRHDYHQVLTELPRVAAGTRAEEDVRVPIQAVLSPKTRFIETSVTGFDLSRTCLQTDAGDIPYSRLVLALGSRPNDFDIPGLAERVLYLWSANDAAAVWQAVQNNVKSAATAPDRETQQRLLTVVIGGAGATGVELAGALAEEVPQLARAEHLAPDLCRVVLVEAGTTILAGSSPELISRARQILAELRVIVRTNAKIARASQQGFVLRDGSVIEGGLFVWAGGVKAPDIVQGLGFEIGHNGRIKVDQYLRALDRPNVYVAGDLASIVDPDTGMAYPPLAQIAIEEGETVAHNLQAEIEGRPLEPFTYRQKGIVVSVGRRRGVADVMGRTLGGRLARVLKDAIEWEYRQSVKYLRGWSLT